MTTYSKTSVVWNKDTVAEMPAGIVSEIEAKKDEMLAAGTMLEQQGFVDGTDTVTNLNRFSTREAAEAWCAFIGNIATANSLNLISSRIVDVTHND